MYAKSYRLKKKIFAYFAKLSYYLQSKIVPKVMLRMLLKTKKNEIIHFNHDIDRIVSHFNLSLDLININDII